MSEYCFLNCKLVVVTSRLAIFLRLTGVSKLFAPTWKLMSYEVTRSFTSSEPGINPSKTPPLQTPETDVIPATFISSLHQ